MVNLTPYLLALIFVLSTYLVFKVFVKEPKLASCVVKRRNENVSMVSVPVGSASTNALMPIADAST